MKNNFYDFSKKQKQCLFVGIVGVLFSATFCAIAILDFKRYWYAIIPAILFAAVSFVIISRLFYVIGRICSDQMGIWSQIGNRKYRFMEWSKIKKFSFVTDTNGDKYLVLSKNLRVSFGDDRIYGGILSVFEDYQTLIFLARKPLVVHCENMLKPYGVSLEIGGLDRTANTEEMGIFRKNIKKKYKVIAIILWVVLGMLLVIGSVSGALR